MMELRDNISAFKFLNNFDSCRNCRTTTGEALTALPVFYMSVCVSVCLSVCPGTDFLTMIASPLFYTNVAVKCYVCSYLKMKGVTYGVMSTHGLEHERVDRCYVLCDPVARWSLAIYFVELSTYIIPNVFRIEPREIRNFIQGGCI